MRNQLFLAYILVFMLLLTACQAGSGQDDFPSAEELSFLQTKKAFVDQTRQAIILQTQGRYEPTVPTTFANLNEPSPVPPPIEVTATLALPLPTASVTPTLVPLFTQPPRDTATLEPVYTDTPTNEPPAEPTAKATPTQGFTFQPRPTSTISPSLSWDGEWSIYTDLETETGTTFRLTLQTDGNQVFGDVVLDEIATSYIGDMSANRLTLSGMWFRGVESGYFVWHMVNENQFTGTNDSRTSFCGSRNGAKIPMACFQL